MSAAREPRYLVVPAESTLAVRTAGDPVDVPRTVPSLLVVELDAETMAAAGWPVPQ